MNNNTKMIAGALAGAAVLVGITLFVMQPSGTGAGAADPSSGAAEQATPPSELPFAPSARTLAEFQALTAPEKTVETQVRSLLGDKQDVFRATFLPAVGAQLDAAAWEACKKRVKEQPVDADWAGATEEKTTTGATVRRVTLLGGVKVGFHQVGRHWLADTIWCRAPAQ